MTREMLDEAEDGSGGVLSARELEVLLLASRGFSNRQIAASLHLLANTYDKMDVGSRGEATRKALLEEWITISDISEEEDA